MNTKTPFRLIVLGLLLAVACQPFQKHPNYERMLTELDGYLNVKELYLADKTKKLDAIRSLMKVNADPRMRFDLEMQYADEAFAFSFDTTRASLLRCLDLAQQLHDKNCYNLASIKLGHLYAKSGHYMEAHSRLFQQVDTNALTEAQRTEWLLTLYDFSRDLAGNSGMVEQLAIPDRESYRQRLYKRIPRDSENWRLLRMDQLIREGRYDSADSLGTLLVNGAHIGQHKFAIYAFEMSEIANYKGDEDGQMEWLVKSAESDIVNGVRDYASLTMVGLHMVESDLDRAFRYMRISQEDALAYNAKLRPWQIAHSLKAVEDAYLARQAKTQQTIRVFTLLMLVLLVLLSAAAAVLINRSKKLSKLRKQLEISNEKLSAANISLNGLNLQLASADKLKEQYILEFLEGLSNQISLLRVEDNRFRNLLKQGKADQLLKELSIAGRSEKARDEFYETFDRVFLAMYPTFVEDFNALLQEEARIRPPKGRLNTELRIFALIRLDVDDSKKIASMLDYSVSTIYNYKVAIKNAALGDREGFEEQVKSIGK